MYCPKCGHKNLDEAAFCVKCGAKMMQNNTYRSSYVPPANNYAENNTYSYSSGNTYSSISNDVINPWILRGLFILPILTLFLAFFDFKLFSLSGFDLMIGGNITEKLSQFSNSIKSAMDIWKVILWCTSFVMIIGVCLPNVVTPIISALVYIILMILTVSGSSTEALQALGVGFYLGLILNLIMVAIMGYVLYQKRKRE